MGGLRSINQNSAGVPYLLAQLLAFPGVQIRNRLMHPHLGQSTKDGDEPFSSDAIATSVAAHPRRSLLTFDGCQRPWG